MRFLSFISYLILIQLSTSCAGPVRSSRRSEVKSSLAPRKYANIQSRSDHQDNQQLTNETTSEDLIATTENSLPIEDSVNNVQSSPAVAGPSELLADISASTAAAPSAADVTDPPIDPVVITPDVVATAQVSPEVSAIPMDLPVNPAVPTAPESTHIPAAPLETVPLDPVAPPVAVTSNPPPTEVPVLPPVTLPKLVLNNTESGVKKATPAVSVTYDVPKGGVKPNFPKHRPIQSSYNPPDTINPYLGEELDKPIYLPPTFAGPAALPAAINLYASDEDNFPPIPFSNSKPKKLEFPPVSNTDENFGYQIDWW